MGKRCCLEAVALLGLLCAVVSPVAAAEDPNRTFEALFGQEAEKVGRSPSKKDDVALAEKLLAAAVGAPDSPAFQVLLYEKAYDLAVKSKEGYPTAIEAMGRLAGAAPRRKGECDRKLLAVYELQYRYGRGTRRVEAGSSLCRQLVSRADGEADAGDATAALATYRRAYVIARAIRSADGPAITAKINAVVARQRLDREIASLEKALANKPEDRRVAGRLLMLRLVEKNDPRAAAALLPSVAADEATRTCLPLATKRWHELDEAAYLDLAGWYQSLARKATAAARPRMLARARAYYQTYLTLRGKTDAAALRATMPLKKLNQQLAPLGWVDCGFLPPPKGVTKALAEWTKQRDALPVRDRLAAIEKKLSEASGPEKITARSHEIKDGRIVSLSFKGIKGLASITPLYGMRLVRLNLADTKVDYVEPLRGMKLEELSLWHCHELLSVEGLEGMPLTKLELYDTKKLTSLVPLRGMRLTALELTFSAIRSLKGLEGMPLEELDLGSCDNLADIEALRGMRLRKLNLSACTSVKSYQPLRGLPLRSLRLRHSSLRDLALLKGMPLRSLDISGMPITTLSPLRGMKLTRLTVGGDQTLRSLKGIEAMPLEFLDIKETRFATKKVADDLKKKIPTLKEVKIEEDKER